MSASPLSPSSSTEAPRRSASPEAPVTPSPSPRKGRDAFAAFKNNLLNINPTDYMWVKNYSGNSRLCRKCSPSSEPVQAQLWIVGYLDSHTLDSAAQSYDAWTITLCLSPEYNRSLDALLKTGPFKSYAPPTRYSLLKVKATLNSVQDDYQSEYLSTTSPFPFTYDGSSLVEGVSLHLRRVEVHRAVLGRGGGLRPRVPDGGPGTVLLLRLALRLPPWRPSGKLKGGCVISPRRLKGARFVADPSSEA
ncbi:hypothetical protein V8E54_009360 [Elaphomyces granulatus]